jgi:hypothetical protein
MREHAERDDDGRLVWERTVPALAGGTTTIEVDVTALLTPGRRQTGNVAHLVTEAELYAERDAHEWGGNPARPVDSETAARAIERIEAKGLTPAWRLVDNPGEFP